jgi:hypothetical protein
MIQRYDIPGGSLEVALHTGELVPSPDGELMLHSEHVKAMNALQEKLDEAESDLNEILERDTNEQEQVSVFVNGVKVTAPANIPLQYRDVAILSGKADYGAPIWTITVHLPGTKAYDASMRPGEHVIPLEGMVFNVMEA